MNLRFKATEFGAQTRGRVILVGASNSKSAEAYHCLTLKRSIDPKGQSDAGIYFEIDDPINGGHGLLQSCECSSQRIVCHLAKGVKWYPELRTVEVILGRTRSNYPALVGALRRMFHNRARDLTVQT